MHRDRRRKCGESEQSQVQLWLTQGEGVGRDMESQEEGLSRGPPGASARQRRPTHPLPDFGMVQVRGDI